MVLAWVGAATVTAIVTMAMFTVGALVSFTVEVFRIPSGHTKGYLELSTGLGIALAAGGYAAALSLIAFGIGIALFCAPAWWLLHKAGLQNAKAFMLTGAGLSVIGGSVLALPIAPLLAIPGGAAGWIIWRLGYERP